MHKIPSLQEEKMFIPGPSGRIEAMVWGFPPFEGDNSPPTPLQRGAAKTGECYIAVVCHPHPLYQGSMHNKVVTTICRAWQNLNIPTVRFNFRGVGESEGQYDHGIGERFDLEAVLRFFQERLPKVQFWLGGFSFGSYIALQVAAAAKDFASTSFPVKASSTNVFSIQALLSVAPPVYHPEFDKTIFPACPWLIIQGTEDTVAPFDQVSNWATELKTKKPDLTFMSMEGAEHFFHGRLVELKTMIQDWFRSLQKSFQIP